MRVKTIVDEDFVNYKIPSMFVGTISCGGKCCHEAGIPITVCQNDEWRKLATINLCDRALCERFLNNPISKAIVFGGLEPFEQFSELENFVEILRNEYFCSTPVIIYTGYNKAEIEDEIAVLSKYSNIIVKFGRYVPGQAKHYDEVLGVELASDNQYAEVISK